MQTKLKLGETACMRSIPTQDQDNLGPRLIAGMSVDDKAGS